METKAAVCSQPAAFLHAQPAADSWDRPESENELCIFPLAAKINELGAKISSRLLKKDFHRLLPHSYLSQRERRFRKEASFFMQGVGNRHHSN